MSTGSTATTETRGRAESWLRRLGLPAAAAILLGAIGGGAFYYLVELRSPGFRRTTPAAARRLASTHTLVALGGTGDETPAFAVVARAGGTSSVLTVPPTLVLEVPGVGPRTMTLALRQAGPGGAAVALANTLRILVPSSVAGSTGTVATTVDEAGGVTVDVPSALRSSADGSLRPVFGPGRVEMSGADFVRYMTGRYAQETDHERDVRQHAGWRSFLGALAASGKGDLLRNWTTDIDGDRILHLLRQAGRAPTPLTLPTTAIALSGEGVVRIDDRQLSTVRSLLSDISNGAETADGRRVRLIIAADGPVGGLVGRILVNAGYVVEVSGKAARRSEVTRISVSPSIEDAESTGKDIAGLLGMGSVRVSTDSDTAADIMLVIGMDWAEANGFPQR